jgi:hypothetical protein
LVPLERPETELLLRCARVSKSQETAARIEELVQESMDWEYLLRTARRHRVAPLLYWHLDATCPEALPESVLDRLRDHFRANNLRNLFLTGELLRILSVLEACGIPAIPYKGPALAASLYGNLALREFSDLDILVPQRYVPRAKETLASLEYRPQYQLTRAQEAALLRSESECGFTRDDGKSVVELHWGIIDRRFSFPLDPACLWSRLERNSLGGKTVPAFSPEDMLLILCAHGSKHLWKRLGWICDVAQLVHVHENLRWDQVMVRARALGAERMLLLGLFLASDLLGTALPEEVSRRVRADPTVKVLAGRIRERLFWEAGDQTALLEGSYFRPLYLKMRERWLDKIRYCIRTVTTQSVEDLELLPLPKSLFSLYYVLRSIRLTGKYGRRLLGRLS